MTTLRELAEAASSGPWHWWGSRKRGMYLGRWGEWGKTTVMDFVRQGMSGAQPRFGTEHQMVKAEHLAVQEVPYRDDVVDIDHPDARFIAAADPTTILGLLDERDRLLDGVLVGAADRSVLDGICGRIDAAFRMNAHDAEFNGLVELYQWVDKTIRARPEAVPAPEVVDAG